MSRCWSEGALRAYQDRELPPEDMELAAAHLGGCAECAELSKNLAGRAARVSVWMEALSGPERVLVPRMPRRGTARRSWAVVAGAIAAGLAIAAVLVQWQKVPLHNRPGHTDVAAGPAPIGVVTPPSAVADAAAPATSALSPKRTRPRRVRQATPPAGPATDFLALDDEPIETGVVMRVGVEPGNVQADIVF